MPQMCVSLQKYPKMYVVIYLSARSWTSWIWHFEIAFVHDFCRLRRNHRHTLLPVTLLVLCGSWITNILEERRKVSENFSPPSSYQILKYDWYLISHMAFSDWKIFGVFAHGCKQNGGLLVGHFSSPRWDGYGAALNLLFSSEMSSIQSTLEALSSVDSLVGTLKACIWKQDKIIREQREEIENLQSLVRELEKERKELRRQIATERTNSSNSNVDETKTPDEKDRWGKIFV